jgi:hypothetical protein
MNHANLNYEELKAVVDNYKPGEITKSNTIIKYLESHKCIKVKEWLEFDPEQTYTEKVVPLMDEHCVIELQKILKIFYDLYPEINPEKPCKYTKISLSNGKFLGVSVNE